jgi:hypothetical protein
MTFHPYTIGRLFIAAALLAVTAAANAQSGGAGTLRGTVTDPSGAVIPNAAVHLTNQISGLDRTATSDGAGQFTIPNVPFNPYRIQVKADGFAALNQNIAVNSSVGTTVTLVMQIAGNSQTVTVEAQGDLIEDDPTFHTDVDRDLFNKVPLESQSSTLSSLVTLTTPGVSADSNGLFHGLGDHASNSFSVDGQSITDQQSKVFSNQLPSNSIQSIEVISGAPPAEYGDKTSLVIVATTRSGLGVTKPTGSFNASYGSFGSAAGGVDLSYGGQKWGNFIETDFLNTGRFLDPPEFTVFHDKGNEENVFDRVDYNLTQVDSVHLDLNYSRSWFQTPNAFQNLNVQNVIKGGTSATPTFANVGNTDQRSKIGTFNISPTYTRIVSQYSVWNLGAFVRKDLYNYFPSKNPLADLGPANLQTSSISQIRTLMNAATHTDFTYARGHNNIKMGAQYGDTFVRESDTIGIVEAIYNAPCVDANGNPLPGYSNPANCGAAFANPNYIPVLAPYDLTRNGASYYYHGQTDVKELALYIEDQIKAGNWNFNLGIRGDKYDGLTKASQVEPRVGIAYNVKRTGSVMQLSYARTLETPFNENLVLSSKGCGNAVLAPLLNCSPGVSSNMQPGFRNEFHAGLQQQVGKNFVIGGEYIWKYTHNAFDFSVLGNTPITFPIDWHNSKIPGFAIHASVPGYHNFSAFFDTSSVAARFFPPQVAGAGATVAQGINYPFRIDHDEKFNQTTHLQYTIAHGGKFVNGIWGGVNWRYDSGMVAGAAPCYNPLTNDPNSACANTSTTLGGQPAVNLSSLTADEEYQAGLICNGVAATPFAALPAACLASQFSSSMLRIPAPGTGDNDHSPQRIAPRDLFDASLGKSNIFHRDRFKTDLDFTAVNIANKKALYNFLSTFSGTHYVTPRALTAKLTVNF